MRLPVRRPLAPPAQPLVAPRGTINSFFTDQMTSSGAWSSSSSRTAERQEIDDGLRRARVEALAAKESPIIPPTVERRQDRQLTLLLKLSMKQVLYDKEEDGESLMKSLCEGRNAVKKKINAMDTEYRDSFAGVLASKS